MKSSPDTRAALILAVVAAGLCIVFRLLPPDLRGDWNLTPLGAMFLFCGAKLSGSLRYALPFAVLGLTDIGFYLLRGWPLSPSVYLSYLLYVFLGQWLRWLEARTRSDLTAAAAGLPLALLASCLFFLLTNTEAWINQALPYGYSFAGLLKCYEMGLPFWRGTLLGDLVFTAGLFGSCVLLSRLMPAPAGSTLMARPGDER
jgi:hypothetical protein